MRSSPFAFRFASAILLAVSVVGLDAAPATAAETHVNESKYGFSFSMPSNWVQVPLNGSDISGLIARATKDDPSLDNALSSQIKKAAAQGIKFFAIGPVQGRVSPNLNIIVTSSSTGLTGKAYFQAADAQVKIELTQAGVEDLKTSVLRLHMGKALQVSYSIPTRAFGVTEHGVQLYVTHKSQLYILTFTSSALKNARAMAHEVEDSWHWK